MSGYGLCALVEHTYLPSSNLFGTCPRPSNQSEQNALIRYFLIRILENSKCTAYSKRTRMSVIIDIIGYVVYNINAVIKHTDSQVRSRELNDDGIEDTQFGW